MKTHTYIAKSDAEARALAGGEHTELFVPCKLDAEANPGRDLMVDPVVYPAVHVGMHSYDNDKPLMFGAMFTGHRGGDVFVACPFAVGDVLAVKEATRTKAGRGKGLCFYRRTVGHLTILSLACRQQDGVWGWAMTVERRSWL